MYLGTVLTLPVAVLVSWAYFMLLLSALSTMLSYFILLLGKRAQHSFVFSKFYLEFVLGRSVE